MLFRFIKTFKVFIRAGALKVFMNLFILPFFYVFITPLITSILLQSFGKFLNLNLVKRLSMSSSIGMSTYTYVISFIFFRNEGKSLEFLLCTWFNLGHLMADISLFSDTLTIIMLCVITSVSNCVHTYSTGYMALDPHLIRFLSYLHLFTFFMILLVTSGNFLQLFVGWEGVGLCSYLLINFWYTRVQANKAAIKAVIINRIGDTSLAIAIFLIFSTFGTLDFVLLSTILKDSKLFLIDVNTIALFLFIASMGKSAQIGLHTWLPDAMEGPTPVSALIHAATMVTAGVFLIVRCSFLFQEALVILPFITLVGALTCFLGATVALFQNDIKKVIAYSTCSQLGYMVMSCGLTCFTGAMFHLYTHAFFKALLFLTAGNIIHALNNEQDMRRMGGLIKILPFSYTMMLIGSLALMGAPFLSGYYSKEYILEISFLKFSVVSHFAFWLGTFSAGCTAFYSMRALFLIFYGQVNSYKKLVASAQDSNYTLSLPIMSLALSAIFSGYSFKRIFNGAGSPFWSNSISLFPNNYYDSISIHFLPLYIKVIPLFFSFFGAMFALTLYTFVLKNKKVYRINKFYTFFNRKWFFDGIYNDALQGCLLFGHSYLFKLTDRGILEAVGIRGSSKSLSLLGLFAKEVATGLTYHYFLYFCAGLVFFFNIYILNLFKAPQLMMASMLYIILFNN
jgi:proton-translocating NADH-quinone oxidoreductase chain L